MTELVELAGDLIAISSVNPMGRADLAGGACERDLSDYLTRFFDELGVPHVRQPVSPGRDNVIAWLDGSPARGSVLFEVHQDTVPVDHMTIAPFTPLVHQGKLYGRGACDVKGAMAAMLMAFSDAARQPDAERARTVLACTVDEEHLGSGVRELIRSLGDSHRPWPKPDLAVVAEPTDLQIVVAHKGTVRFKIETRGVACHSSNPERGSNAIYRMARVIAALEQHAAELRARPPHPMVGTPSLSVGRIEGGISVNVVPDRCTIEIDRRIVPGETHAEAIAALRRCLGARMDERAVQFHEPWIASPALSPDGNHAVAARLAAAAHAVGVAADVVGVQYGTDASKLAAAGIPAVVCGPGSIAQAHQASEWIDVTQLEQARMLYYRVLAS